MISRGNKGFTLIEAMIALGILGIMSVVIIRLYMGGITMWASAKDSFRLATESKIAMAAITKFVQAANGTSLCISRFDSSQPANSYISGVLTDTVYITSTTSVCGGGGSEYFTGGSNGDSVEFFQKGHYLLAVRPVPIPGADITNPDVDHFMPQCITISANLDSLQFTYDNSISGSTVVVGMKFSRLVYGNRPPITTYLNKAIVIRHQYGTGFYGN